ncbi:Protein IVY1 [Hypsizygus marmoreus]|uniref:Protein IVY1 n=1 Tax=Hypsizygus marmoreus TaxID=39966 RepID=A0A369JU61_HYPMA|nr:Protein IVY1 [Hypsizygus marmoreus]
MAPSRPRSLRVLTFGSSRRKSSPEPPSPTFSESTHASAMNFGADGPEKIITRANLRASIQAYEELMNASAEYRAALLTMSKVTAAFADALETCSGLKGPSYEAGTRLQAASGLHHLIGNHWHVLAETIDKKFEKPLRQHLDTYRIIVNDRSASYERVLREKSQIIRDTEMRNMNRKERNLQTFREALIVLQRQVDELDDLKASHYREIIEHEEQVWEVVQAKTCVVVRSTMDVFDRFTAKASDPVIELMLQSVPDPFDSYGPPQAEDQIFSILAPLSIMTTQSSSPSPMTGSSELDTEATPSDKITSWLPKTSNGVIFPSESTEWAGVPSPTSTPPRSVSPPIVSRRHSTPPSAGPRKSESKLRSVLTVIDETRTQLETDPHEASGHHIRTTSLNGKAPPPDTGQQQPDWSFTYGQSPYDDIHDDSTATPRHSALFFPQATTTLPPDRSTEPPKEPDGLVHTVLAPVVS